MFSHNQKLEVSGSLNGDNGYVELYRALKFALEASDLLDAFIEIDNHAKCVFQITEDGRYCIGWSSSYKLEEGWNEYQFGFDLGLISRSIAEHLMKQKIKDNMGYDCYEKGFLMRAIPNTMRSEYEGIKKPFYGIVEFKPYPLFYAK